MKGLVVEACVNGRSIWPFPPNSPCSIYAQFCKLNNGSIVYLLFHGDGKNPYIHFHSIYCIVDGIFHIATREDVSVTFWEDTYKGDIMLNWKSDDANFIISKTDAERQTYDSIQDAIEGIKMQLLTTSIGI